MPLLGAVLDLEIPETVETAQLEEQFRRPRLAVTTSELLGALAAGPMLLIVEDVHWLDEASADILRSMASAVGTLPWLVCVTRRPETTGFSVSREESVVVVDLQPLDAGMRRTSSTSRRRTRPFPITPSPRWRNGPAGTPCSSASSWPTRPRPENLGDLPDSVEAVIAARIDRLRPRERNVLRRASVLGRSFPEALLHAVMDDLVEGEDDLWSRLDGLIVRNDDGTLSSPTL